jgi:hypothetical protein
MPNQYNPTSWYWLASDGRVFASAKQAIVDIHDADYEAWLAEGNIPTSWPTDTAGNQTDTDLQWVFDNAGVSIYVDLKSYAENARFLKETGGIIVGGVSVSTDRDSQAMIANAYAYVTANGVASVSYKATSGFVTLDAATLKAVALAVGAHVQACFAAEAAVVAGIASGTIKTTADVDAVISAV